MIIVSLTTIPERLDKHLPSICISSILRQTMKPDYIIINIPEFSKKGEQYSFELAKKLEHLSVLVKVQYGVNDLGPITKIVPTLNFIQEKGLNDASIILVDDDCVYDPKMIENLITIKKNHPNELVIGTAGRIKQRNKLEFTGTVNYSSSCSGIIDHIYVDIIETFAGVMYDYSLFKNTNFIEWISKLPNYVMLADDIVLSIWAKKQGAKLYKIIQNRSNIITHDPKNTTELNKINDIGGNNDKVFDYFIDSSYLLTESSDFSFAKFASKLN